MLDRITASATPMACPAIGACWLTDKLSDFDQVQAFFLLPAFCGLLAVFACVVVAD